MGQYGGRQPYHDETGSGLTRQSARDVLAHNKLSEAWER